MSHGELRNSETEGFIANMHRLRYTAQPSNMSSVAEQKLIIFGAGSSSSFELQFIFTVSSQLGFRNKMDFGNVLDKIFTIFWVIQRFPGPDSIK